MHLHGSQECPVRETRASTTPHAGARGSTAGCRSSPWVNAERGGILFRLLAVGVLIVFVLAGVVFYRSILGALGSWLVVQDAPARSDAIIVLSGDSPRAPPNCIVPDGHRWWWPAVRPFAVTFPKPT